MWTGGRTEYSVQYEVISYCMSRSAEYFAHLPVQWAILRTVLCMVRLLGRTDRQGKGSGGAGWVGGKHVLEELDEPKSTGPCIGRGGTVRAVAMTGGEWLLSLERDGCPSSRTPCRITVGTDDTVVCDHQSGHSDGVSSNPTLLMAPWRSNRLAVRRLITFSESEQGRGVPCGSFDGRCYRSGSGDWNVNGVIMLIDLSSLLL